MDMLDLLLHVIHEQVLPEGIRRGEVGLAAADFGDLLDEEISPVWILINSRS